MVLTKGHRVWRKLKPRSALLECKDVTDGALLFESDSVATLSPMEADLVRQKYTESVQAYALLGVLRVNVATKSHSYMALVTECQSVGKVLDAEVFRITQATLIPLGAKAELELVLEVGKLLACGQFYFSHPNTALFDLLSPAQIHGSGREQKHFCWNRAMYPYLERFGIDCKKWLYRIMCGGVQIHTVYAGDKQAKACLFSRLSCERAGTRFHVRGVNDEGHVANFVETELAIYVDNSVASFVQTRGLVPVFWDQPGIQSSGIEHIKLSRGYRCTQPAFERHFEWCLLQYGPQLCVNLLGSKEHEQLLTSSYQDHMKDLNVSYCAEFVCFDYHSNCKGTGAQATLQAKLLPRVQPFFEAHSYYLSLDGKVKKRQTGTVRTNCFDCLDRTNSVQEFFGLHVTKELVSVLNLATKPSVIARFEQVFAAAWAENGDSLSKLYAGTRAIKGKRTFMEGARSVQRAIVNNFLDGTKQDAIEMLLLGNAYTGDLGQKVKALLDPVDTFAPLPLQQALCGAWSTYTTPHKLRVCAATWNVNGGKHIRSIALKNHSMEDWLLDAPVNTHATERNPEEFSAPPDIYAVGFEELVGLTASNIVSASSTNRREWGEELQRVLSRDCPYALLTAEQLVGICLFVFVRPTLIPYIRDVHISTVKTGMSGNAGNKGGVAIRFLLHATSLCFVCSHLAAHQNKVGERNQDFHDICKKIQFPHGATLDSHDYVFWMGDLNYRIDLPITAVKSNIQQQLWEKLWKQEQLNRQKQLGKAFTGFIEGALNFAPTFKYDDFSDDYDTSEKSRIPAWCDRVLWKRKPYVSLGQGVQPNVASDGTPPASTTWDFGPHQSDAGSICSQYMDGGGNLVNTGHPWHPGRLLFYGRAELKTSDHRPVVAIVEIDVYKVDPKKRGTVREETLHTLGPLNPTVIIRDKVRSTTLNIASLLDALATYGKVVLIRMQDDMALVTFQHPEAALAATTLHGHQIGGVTVDVRLVTPADAEELSGHQLKQPARLRVLTSEELTSYSALDDVGESGPTELSFSATEEVHDSSLEPATSTDQLEEEEEEEVEDWNQDQEANPLNQDQENDPSSSEDEDTTAVPELPTGDDTEVQGRMVMQPVRPPRPKAISQTKIGLQTPSEGSSGLPRNKSSSSSLHSMDSQPERAGGTSIKPQRPPAPQLTVPLPQESTSKAPLRLERSHTPETLAPKPPVRPGIPDIMPFSTAPVRPDIVAAPTRPERPLDVTSAPTRPDRPSISDTMNAPTRPGKPSDIASAPTRPERPSVPDIMAAPTRPERPSVPDIMAAPTRPERPSVPDIMAAPTRPERPSVPDIMAAPTRPERPSVPDIMAAPTRPERPNVPDIMAPPTRPERPSVLDTTTSSKPPSRPERTNISDTVSSSTAPSRADRSNVLDTIPTSIKPPPRPERPSTSISDTVTSSAPPNAWSEADTLPPSRLPQLPPARPPPPKKA